jgi:hypothetical protein
MWTRAPAGLSLPQATNLLTACTLGRITAGRPPCNCNLQPATFNWVHLHSAALHCTSGQGGQPTACPGGHPGAPYRVRFAQRLTATELAWFSKLPGHYH